MLDQNKQIKLVDFAHSLRIRREPPTYVEKMGSVEFASPECAQHVPVTTKTDIWSVGVLTYIL
jgi:serine/threonine protein kinase